MGKISDVRPVKLIAGFIFRDILFFEKAKEFLCRKYGAADFESDPFPFDLSDYYADEFGTGLTRKFLSFKKLIQPVDLADVKTFTNKLERRLSLSRRRTVNIDPGYLNLAKLVLASTKDYVHRIYLSRGIFAEVTLFFKGKSFNAREWTYPDYRSKSHIALFNKIRDIYAFQLKGK